MAQGFGARPHGIWLKYLRVPTTERKASGEEPSAAELSEDRRKMAKVATATRRPPTRWESYKLAAQMATPGTSSSRSTPATDVGAPVPVADSSTAMTDVGAPVPAADRFEPRMKHPAKARVGRLAQVWQASEAAVQRPLLAALGAAAAEAAKADRQRRRERDEVSLADFGFGGVSDYEEAFLDVLVEGMMAEADGRGSDDDDDEGGRELGLLFRM